MLQHFCEFFDTRETGIRKKRSEKFLYYVQIFVDITTIEIN